jgi:transposase-like protein
MAKPAGNLRGGIDYPRDRVEFDVFFPDDEACEGFLERLRWGSGFVCPACSATGTPWRSSRGLVLCPRCRLQISPTAGTIFHRRRAPLRLWFLAAWEITSQKYGASALGIQRILGLGSYQTAWAWLHKFRRAMVRQGRDGLSGLVEADETYVGGEESGVRGRQTVKKAVVAVAVEVNGGKMGRVRLHHVQDCSESTLGGLLSDVVVPGSTIHTDGWSGYQGLIGRGFKHEVTVLSTSPDPAHVVMPAVHRVASLLKRWILGTLQGGISKEHLPYYLDEFSFRFNRRNSRARGLLFYRLLEQATVHAPTTTAQLYCDTGRGPRRGHGEQITPPPNI